MRNEIEGGTHKLDSSSHTNKSRPRQELGMDSQENEFSTSELALKSVDERIRQATDSIRRRVEELSALLASQSD